MAYKIKMLPEAEKALAAVPQKLQRRIAHRIDALARDPRPPHCRKLQGSSHDLYRVRVGDYRIVYQIQEEVLTILIVRIGDRKEVYQAHSRLALNGEAPRKELDSHCRESFIIFLID